MWMPEKRRILLAIAMTLAAIVGFDIMGILVRILTTEYGYGAAELSAYRNVLGILPSLIALAWMGELRFTREALSVPRPKLALVRGLAVATAQLCFYTALGLMELATISALAQTNAMFVVLLSVLMFREKVGPWRIFALVLGFAGAVWVLRPGTDAFSLVALLPICAAFCYGFSVVSVRFFDSSVSSALLYLWSSAASVVGGVVLALSTTGFSHVPMGYELLLIFALSMAGGTAVLLLMFAYRIAAPSILAPFSYVGILTAFTFGWLFFGEAPVDTLFPGVLLIVGAGAVIIWREQFVKAKPLPMVDER